MVHELLGLNDNRVVLKGAPGVRKDLEEVRYRLRTDPVVAARCIENFTKTVAARDAPGFSPAGMDSICDTCYVFCVCVHRWCFRARKTTSSRVTDSPTSEI